jgi:hypothetical protein
VVPEVPLTETNPCILLFDDIWPILEKLNELYASDLAEPLCRIFKNCIISYDQHLIKMAPLLTSITANSYQKYRRSCYLWLSSYIIRKYLKNAEDKSSFLVMIEKICVETFSIFRSSADMDKDPDVVDDFLRLIISCFETMPMIIFGTPFFKNICTFSLHGLLCFHKDSLDSSLFFFRDLLWTSLNRKKIVDPVFENVRGISINFFSDFANILITSLIRGIVGTSSGLIYPGALYNVASEILNCLAELIGHELFFRYLSQALNSTDVPLLDDQKNRLLNEVGISIQQKRPEKIRYGLAALSSSIRNRIAHPHKSEN